MDAEESYGIVMMYEKGGQCVQIWDMGDRNVQCSMLKKKRIRVILKRPD